MAKKEQTEAPEDTSSFANRYRPKTLDQIIGHETAVTRLRGMIAEKKLPSALLIIGPTSAGKTTLARAFATDVNGVKGEITKHPDYKEINAASQRGIDDMRALESVARYAPQSTQRFIVVDESQQLLANKAAAMSLLKPIEEPAKRTTWILCSMDPTKFSTGDGRAIANRCKQIVLEPHTEKQLLKQALRIAKGEDMKYVLDDERKILSKVVEASNGEMRTLANLMEDLYDYYHGLEDRPKKLKLSDINTVLSSSEAADDKLVIQVLLGVYAQKYAKVARAILDVTDGFQFVNKLIWANSFLLNNEVLDGQKHRKVWWSAVNKELHYQVKDNKPGLGVLAMTNAALVETKGQAGQFLVPSEELLSARLYRLIKELQAYKK